MLCVSRREMQGSAPHPAKGLRPLETHFLGSACGADELTFGVLKQVELAVTPHPDPLPKGERGKWARLFFAGLSTERRVTLTPTLSPGGEGEVGACRLRTEPRVTPTSALPPRGGRSGWRV
jgi:hypothetical protein